MDENSLYQFVIAARSIAEHALDGHDAPCVYDGIFKLTVFVLSSEDPDVVDRALNLVSLDEMLDD